MIEHALTPEHKKLDKEETEKILEKYNVSKRQLPRIKANDAGIKGLECSPGDMVEVTRKSEIYGNIKFYRIVAR